MENEIEAEKNSGQKENGERGMNMEVETEIEQGTELKLIETRTHTRAFRLTLDEDEKLEKYAAERNVTPTVVIKSALKQTGVI